jgi:hypothetical protein
VHPLFDEDNPNGRASVQVEAECHGGAIYVGAARGIVTQALVLGPSAAKPRSWFP